MRLMIRSNICYNIKISKMIKVREIRKIKEIKEIKEINRRTYKWQLII